MAAMALFGSNGPVEVSIVPALDAMTADVRPALTILLAAVALLLATATANVASLQLARVTTRRRELAVRAAIGAGAGRLARQLLVESTLLGVAGGLAGVLLAHLLLRGLPLLLPADFPRMESIAVDPPVMLFALALSLMTSIAFGLLPSLHVRRVNLVASLSEDNLAPVGGTLRSTTVRARAAIMIGQVAVACVLLVGAALLTRSFIALMNADRGFDPSGLLTARVPMAVDYPPERRTQLLEAVTDRLKGLPGVTHVAFANALPLVSTGGYSAFNMRSPRNPGIDLQVEAAQRIVSPGYFGALRLRIIEGRPLDETDTATSRRVVVVNRSFASKYLGEPAIGARIPWQRSAANVRAEWEVIGVVEDVRQNAVDGPNQPEIIAPYAQVRAMTTRSFDPIVVVRTSGDPTSYVSALRNFVRGQDPSLALDSVMTMDERVSTSLARPRTYAVLVGGFAVFAVVIAAVGLFGVLAYSVAQRSREIGVRSALGAPPLAIVGLVVRQALWVTAAGVITGLALAAVTMRALSTFLYGVKPRDPASFAAVAALLLLVAALATVVPARRAANVDPLKVLR
jgi:predicted permease